MAGKNKTLLFRLEQFFTAGVTDVKTIAKRVGCHAWTVYKRLREWKKEGRITEKPRSGRPRKLDGNDRRRLHQLAVRNPLASNTLLASRLQEAGSQSVSRWTVGRALVQMQVTRKKPQYKPLLTQRHRDLRVAWCQANKDRDFTRVVFTDESKMQFYSNIRKRLCKTRATPICEKQKFGPAVMLWGGVSLRGQTPLATVVGNINSDAYIKILSENLIPSIKQVYPEGFVLQQDNAPCHVSKKTKAFLISEGVELMEWPPNSPDLNVIENVWGLMKIRLSAVERTTVKDWKDRIQQTWKDLSFDYMKSLIDSMPKRIQQVLDREGGHADY